MGTTPGKMDELAKKVQLDDSKITAEQHAQFDRDLFRFYEAFPWYAACFGTMVRALTFSVDTAAVGYKDGDICFVANPDWLFKFPTIVRQFIYMHEIEHVVRAHISVMENYPQMQEALNVVMDSFINESVMQEYYHIFANKNIIGKDSFDGVTYDGLKQLINNAVMMGATPGSKEFPQVTARDYIKKYTTEEIMPTLPKPPEGETDGGFDPFMEAIKECYGDLGEFFSDNSVPDELKDAMLQEMFDEAQKSRGTAPAHLKRYVDKANDKTNRQFRMMMRGLGRSSRISITSSWMKWNKKLPGIRPGKFWKTYPKILVMGDTSGSIGDGEMKSFMKELRALVDKCDMDLAWVDASFDEDNKEQFIKNIKNKKVLNRIPPWGGGGTVFHEFYEYCKKHYGEYQHILMLTDGYADYIPERLVPGQQLLLMTPDHDHEFVKQARACGFKVAIVEDQQPFKG